MAPDSASDGRRQPHGAVFGQGPQAPGPMERHLEQGALGGASTKRRALARVIDLAAAVPLARLTGDAVAAGRPVASLVVAALLVAVYETGFVAWLGATPGKFVTGLRVVNLDSVSCSATAALRRGCRVAACEFLVLPSVVLAVSALGSPGRRGFHDRQSSTVVAAVGSGIVTSAAAARVDLDVERPRTPFGDGASFLQRRRGRAWRLVGSFPVLAVTVVTVFAVSLLGSSVALLAVPVWVVVFTCDEAVRLHQAGQTPGHAREGLVVVDRRTGRFPSWPRSTARAFTTAVTLYIPPLPIVAAGVLRIRKDGRALHDLLAGTVVVDTARTATARSGTHGTATSTASSTPPDLATPSPLGWAS